MKRHLVVPIRVGLLFSIIAVAVLSTVLVTSAGVALANDGAEPGTAACGDAQVAAQDAVEAGGPYKNHGQMVRTAANTTSPLREDGTISEECESCIINQFARRIPIEEQELCGQCEPKTCGTYVSGECVDLGLTCPEFSDCDIPARCVSGGDNLCWKAFDGSGVCGINFWCAPTTDCPEGQSDCAVGEVCVVETCCLVNKCAPAGSFCNGDNPLGGLEVLPQGEGQTAAGQ